MKLRDIGIILGAVATAVLLTACISTDIEVAPKSQFKPSVHKTFAWKAEPIAAPEHIGRGQSYYDIDHYMRKYLTQALIKKGYESVPKAQADFLVEYRFTQQVKLDQGGIISPVDEMNAAWDLNNDLGNTSLHNHYVPAQINEALLEINLSASQSGAVLWQVIASKIIENESLYEEAINSALKKTVPKMVADLPKSD